MKRILLIEDTSILANEISDILKMENYSVTIAANGARALAFLQLEIPDIIVTDLLMPEVDGFTFIKKIKADKTTQHIPIIVLSAKTDEETIARVKALGVNGFVKKPCKPQVLLHAIQAQ